MPRAIEPLIGVLDDGSMTRSHDIPANPRLVLVQGEDVDVKVTAYKADGTLLDMTGMAIYLTVKAKASDADPLISRAGTITTSTAVFQIGAADWVAEGGEWLLSAKAYKYDVWLVGGSARAPLIPIADLVVTATIGDADDVPTSYAPLYSVNALLFGLWSVRTVADATALGADDQVLLLTGASEYAVTLPNPASVPGRVLIVKDGDGSCDVNPKELVATVGYIDGVASYSIPVAWGSVTLMSTGSDWIVLATNIAQYQ